MRKKYLFQCLCPIVIGALTQSCVNDPDYVKSRIDSYKEFSEYRDSELKHVQTDKVYALNDCLDLAVSNNLELFALKLEQQVSDDKAMAHLLTALPSLSTSYNYTARDNSSGATSEGITDGQESLRASTSTDKAVGNFRLEMALSTLDFGLAFINKHYENDQKRKSYINRSKAERELKFQVVQAFYSVSSAQYVLDLAKDELVKNEAALKKVEELFNQEQISQFELLRFKRKFLETRKQLREYERSHQNYCLNLSSLLGLMPSKNIIVDTTMFTKATADGRFHLDYEPPMYDDLEKAALHLREELIEMDIDKHLSMLKEKSEILKMFPNVRVFSAYNNSTNSFLFNRSWTEVGFNAVIDFMRIPSRLKNMDAEERQREVLKFKQYSTMLNIIAQLKIAYANVEEVKERLSYKEDIYKLSERENKLTKQAVASGNKNQLDSLEKDIDLVISNIQRTAAFANYNVALHRLLNISASPQRDLRDLSIGKTTKIEIKQDSDKEQYHKVNTHFDKQFKYAKEQGQLKLP